MCVWGIVWVTGKYERELLFFDIWRLLTVDYVMHPKTVVKTQRSADIRKVESGPERQIWDLFTCIFSGDRPSCWSGLSRGWVPVNSTAARWTVSSMTVLSTIVWPGWMARAPNLLWTKAEAKSLTSLWCRNLEPWMRSPNAWHRYRED